MWNICVYSIWNVSIGWKGQYPYTCKENQLTFLELLVTKARTMMMDGCGGKWTAEPLDGGPSNNGNKQRKTLKWLLYTKYAKCVKYDQYKNDIHNMHNMHIIKTICWMSWPNGQGIGLAIVWSPVRPLPPRDKGGALVVQPWMPFRIWW